MSEIKIKQAVVSVSDKNNLKKLVNYFYKNKINILSSGGTFEYLKKINPNLILTKIEDFTNFREILNGRVKTLHPLIHSGILAKKNNHSHMKQLAELGVKPIDLVVVNLYPFEEISNKPETTESDCIENIDIGGPALIRGAAKNFKNTLILTSPNQYESFIREAENNDNKISLNFRKEMAKIAFSKTAYYDGKISSWLSNNENFFEYSDSSIPLKKIKQLRYGENPHQKAAMFAHGKNEIFQISGKDLSFNNIYDLEIAIELAEQFSKDCCVILKHGNPCGVALSNTQTTAYKKALKCDSVSAFGGIIAFNKTVTSATAKEMLKLFAEVIVAPGFDTEALKLMCSKKNLIIVKYSSSSDQQKISIKSTRNFLLIQDKDSVTIRKKDLILKTKKRLNTKLIEDMIFGFTVAKFVNSNAIVLVDKLCTVGIGIGQTNRLDSAKQALKQMKKNFKMTKAIMASDGFFPFPDIVKLCSKNNISGIIQPGGSIKDDQVVKVSEKLKIPMVFTGKRHFKH